MLEKEHKLLFSKLLFNAKDVLFSNEEANEESSTQGQTRKGEKASKWFEILTQLNCVGAEVTDYKKLRDVEWSNLRRAAEKKLATFKANQEKPLDQAQSVVFTQAEEIVLDVLGKGFGNTRYQEIDWSAYKDVSRSTAERSAGILKEELEDLDDDDEVDEKLEKEGLGKSAKKRARTNGSTVGSVSGQAELVELRRKKLRLECMKLELELEKIPLECAKLELEIKHLQSALKSGDKQSSQIALNFSAVTESAGE